MLTDFAPELKNPLTDYLESDPDDTWYEARFKNALEGAFLGGALEGTFRAFRWYKNKKAQANGLPHNKEQLKADEKYLEENPTINQEETLKVDRVGKARAGEVKADEFADTYC